MFQFDSAFSKQASSGSFALSSDTQKSWTIMAFSPTWHLLQASTSVIVVHEGCDASEIQNIQCVFGDHVLNVDLVSVSSYNSALSPGGGEGGGGGCVEVGFEINVYVYHW